MSDIHVARVLGGMLSAISWPDGNDHCVIVLTLCYIIDAYSSMLALPLMAVYCLSKGKGEWCSLLVPGAQTQLRMSPCTHISVSPISIMHS